MQVRKRYLASWLLILGRQLGFGCLGLGLACCAFLELPTAVASEYYVNQNGDNASDTNNGAQTTPWKTVQRAAAFAVAGDVVHVVGPATYDERVKPAASGSPGIYITYKGDGVPVVRGFDLTGKGYVRVVGFEITHPTTAYPYDGVLLRYANHCEVLDCYIHHVNGVGVNNAVYDAYGNNNVVRGNRIAYVGMCQTNTLPSPSTTAIACSGTNNLCEYNEISCCADFFAVYGYQNVIRNNYLHDVTGDIIDPTKHVDCLEQSPSSMNLSSTWTLFERNYCRSNMLANSHGLLLRNSTVGKVVQDVTIRQNVMDYFGSVAVETHVPRTRSYNNTASHVSYLINNWIVSVATDTAAAATNCTFLNNIYANSASNKGTVYAFGDSSLTNTFKNDYELLYVAGTGFRPAEPHGVVSDPAFSSGSYLGVASPALAAGGAQTTTRGPGSATNVVAVADAGFFCDGWGIVTGDAIVVSGNAASTVTNADYANNLLYFASNLTWTNGAPVYLDGTQDIGAYRYRAGGYDYGVSLTVAGSTLTATVTNASVVRFVKFYVDGLEVGTVAAPPYTVTAELTSAPHAFEARAYALYADPKLVRTATVRPVIPPGTLQVVPP